MSDETAEREELERLLYWLRHCPDGQLRQLPDLVAKVRAEIEQRSHGRDDALGDPI
jgi:hypothetical protein